MWVIGSSRFGQGRRRLAAAWCLPLLLILADAARGGPVARPTVVVHAGTLLAIPGQPPLHRQTLVISDGRIAAIRDGFLAPSDVAADGGTRLVDLSSKFVMPGLIDLHVHLTTEVSPGGRRRTVKQGAAELALVAQYNAERTLAAGFTTVLDLGTGFEAHEEAIYALRAAVTEGRVAGPRILAVGSPISATGSSRTGRFNTAVAAALPPQGVCNGADACAAAVREQVRRGADAINFYNSGSLNDVELAAQTFTDEEMRAIVTTAHALGRKVIADGHTAAGINAALRAGADIIDTAPWPDAETWTLLEKTRAFFEPHMYAFRVASEPVGTGTATAALLPVTRRVQDVLSRPFSAQTAHQHGVRLAYGSDTGIVQHGDNAGEFGELVGIGLTPMEAIVVATVNSAAAIGRLGDIGTLETGKRADLIATDGNPLENIAALRRIAFVMRDGLAFEVN